MKSYKCWFGQSDINYNYCIPECLVEETLSNLASDSPNFTLQILTCFM